MTVKEIIIDIPFNQEKQINIINELLYERSVKILALLIYSNFTVNKSSIHLVVNNPDKAVNIFNSQNIEIKTNEVIAVEKPHHTGSIFAILESLKKGSIFIKYFYACSSKHLENVFILGINRELINIALDILKNDWFRIIYGDDLYII